MALLFCRFLLPFAVVAAVESTCVGSTCVGDDNSMLQKSERALRDEMNAMVQPSSPTIVNKANKGEVNDTGAGDAKMYTWWLGGTQRCMMVYIPKNAPRPMPVVIYTSCYAKCQAAKMSSRNEGYDYYGVAEVRISSLEGDWGYNKKFTTDDTPQKCGLEEPWGKSHMHYVRDIFDWLESQPKIFDMSRVITAGHSQNSKMANTIGFCFGNRLAGVVAASGGMDETCKKGSCKYGPIYPCHEPKQLPWCGFVYERDDFKGCKHGMDIFYKNLKAEGNDGRYFIFNGSNHAWPKNWFDWAVGCTGITEKCSFRCESDFKQCFTENFYGSGTEHYTYNMCGMEFHRPKSCAPGCAPTLNMLRLGEKPKLEQLTKDHFGNPKTLPKPVQPKTSKCIAQPTPLHGVPPPAPPVQPIQELTPLERKLQREKRERRVERRAKRKQR